MDSAVKTATQLQYGLLVDEAIHQACSVDYYVDSHNNTLLHLGVIYDCPDCVHVLLSVGANPAVINSNGLTPLELAEELGNQIIVQILNKWGHYRTTLAVDHLEAALLTRRRTVSRIRSSLRTPSVGMIMFTPRNVMSYEDYFEWTDSARRFHLKELLDKLHIDEREDLQKLQQHHSQALLLQRDLQLVDQRLGHRQHRLSVRYWNEEQIVRKLRSMLVAVTDYISEIRYLLSSVGGVTYWSGPIEVRLHKGLIFELWKPHYMQVTGNTIVIAHAGDAKRKKRIVSVEDVVSVVIVKTADANGLDKSLLLEYHKPPLPTKDGRGSDSGYPRRTRSLHLRLSDQHGEACSRPSKLPVAEHFAHVLKLLNGNIEIRCQIDGSRRVEYDAGRGARRARIFTECDLAAAAASPTPPQRVRRATFDASFSRCFDDPDAWDFSSIHYLRDTSRSSLSISAVSRSRGRALSVSETCSSGVTSWESVSSIASVLSLRKSGATLERIAEDGEDRDRGHSRDDSDVPTACSPASPFRHTMSTNPRSLEAGRAVRTHKVPAGSVEDVRYLHDLRGLLLESTKARDKIQGDLELAVARKEALRQPVAYVRQLRAAVVSPSALVSTPPELHLDNLVFSLECCSRYLDAAMRVDGPHLRRGNSFAGQHSGEDVDEETRVSAQALVNWLGTLCDGCSAPMAVPPPAPREPCGSFSMRSFDGWSPRRSSGCMLSPGPGLDADSSKKHNVLSPPPTDLARLSLASFVNRVGEAKTCDAPPVAQVVACRATLGPPPPFLRADFDKAMEGLEGLWKCGQSAFEDAERLAQLLLLREDAWKRYQDLKEETLGAAAPAETELVDVEF